MYRSQNNMRDANDFWDPKQSIDHEVLKFKREQIHEVHAPSLTTDILIHVFSYLPITKWPPAMSVSKSFRHAARSSTHVAFLTKQEFHFDASLFHQCFPSITKLDIIDQQDRDFQSSGATQGVLILEFCKLACLYSTQLRSLSAPSLLWKCALSHTESGNPITFYSLVKQIKLSSDHSTSMGVDGAGDGDGEDEEFGPHDHSIYPKLEALEKLKGLKPELPGLCSDSFGRLETLNLVGQTPLNAQTVLDIVRCAPCAQNISFSTVENFQIAAPNDDYGDSEDENENENENEIPTSENKTEKNVSETISLLLFERTLIKSLSVELGKVVAVSGGGGGGAFAPAFGPGGPGFRFGGGPFNPQPQLPPEQPEQLPEKEIPFLSLCSDSLERFSLENHAAKTFQKLNVNFPHARSFSLVQNVDRKNQDTIRLSISPTAFYCPGLSQLALSLSNWSEISPIISRCCPLLTEIELNLIGENVNFVFDQSFANVRKLKVRECEGTNLESVEIHSPCLETLEISFGFYRAEPTTSTHQQSPTLSFTCPSLTTLTIKMTKAQSFMNGPFGTDARTLNFGIVNCPKLANFFSDIPVFDLTQLATGCPLLSILSLPFLSGHMLSQQHSWQTLTHISCSPEQAGNAARSARDPMHNFGFGQSAIPLPVQKLRAELRNFAALWSDGELPETEQDRIDAALLGANFGGVQPPRRVNVKDSFQDDHENKTKAKNLGLNETSEKMVVPEHLVKPDGSGVFPHAGVEEFAHLSARSLHISPSLTRPISIHHCSDLTSLFVELFEWDSKFPVLVEISNCPNLSDLTIRSTRGHYSSYQQSPPTLFLEISENCPKIETLEIERVALWSLSEDRIFSFDTASLRKISLNAICFESKNPKKEIVFSPEDFPSLIDLSIAKCDLFKKCVVKTPKLRTLNLYCLTSPHLAHFEISTPELRTVTCNPPQDELEKLSPKLANCIFPMKCKTTIFDCPKLTSADLPIFPESLDLMGQGCPALARLSLQGVSPSELNLENFNCLKTLCVDALSSNSVGPTPFGVAVDVTPLQKCKIRSETLEKIVLKIWNPPIENSENNNYFSCEMRCPSLVDASFSHFPSGECLESLGRECPKLRNLKIFNTVVESASPDHYLHLSDLPTYSLALTPSTFPCLDTLTLCADLTKNLKIHSPTLRKINFCGSHLTEKLDIHAPNAKILKLCANLPDIVWNFSEPKKFKMFGSEHEAKRNDLVGSNFDFHLTAPNLTSLHYELYLNQEILENLKSCEKLENLFLVVCQSHENLKIDFKGLKRLAVFSDSAKPNVDEADSVEWKESKLSLTTYGTLHLDIPTLQSLALDTVSFSLISGSLPSCTRAVIVHSATKLPKKLSFVDVKCPSLCDLVVLQSEQVLRNHDGLSDNIIPQFISRSGCSDSLTSVGFSHWREITDHLVFVLFSKCRNLSKISVFNEAPNAMQLAGDFRILGRFSAASRILKKLDKLRGFFDETKEISDAAVETCLGQLMTFPDR